MHEIMFGVVFIAISPFIYMIITKCSKDLEKEEDLSIIITKFEGTKSNKSSKKKSKKSSKKKRNDYYIEKPEPNQEYLKLDGTL